MKYAFDLIICRRPRSLKAARNLGPAVLIGLDQAVRTVSRKAAFPTLQKTKVARLGAWLGESMYRRRLAWTPNAIFGLLEEASR